MDPMTSNILFIKSEPETILEEESPTPHWDAILQYGFVEQESEDDSAIKCESGTMLDEESPTSHCDRILQYGIVNQETENAFAIKCEPGTLVAEEQVEDCGAYSKIDIDYPEIKKECYVHLERVDQSRGKVTTSHRKCCCIVPKCNNTSVTAPDKQFIAVPRSAFLRQRWCDAMKLINKNNAPLSRKETKYCCEDHFDLPNDMENYIRHKIMGLGFWQLKAKKGVVPHKFDCQQPPRWPKRTTGERRRRLQIIKDLLEPKLQPSTPQTEELSLKKLSSQKSSLQKSTPKKPSIQKLSSQKPSPKKLSLKKRFPEQTTGCTSKYNLDKSIKVATKCKHRSIGLSTQTQSISIVYRPNKCNVQNMSLSPLKGEYMHVSESDLSDTSADYVLSDDIEYVEEP